MAPRAVKILGERNTGTNFLERFLAANFDVALFRNAGPLSADQRAYLRQAEPRRAQAGEPREAIWDENHFAQIVSNGGWKHAAPTPDFVNGFARTKQCLVICIVRHPATWLQSMHRNPFHALARVSAEFGAFLRSPWIARPRDGLGSRLLAGPLDLLRLKAESYAWLASMHAPTLILRYEDVLLDPVGTTEHLSGYIEPVRSPPELPGQSARGFLADRAPVEHYIDKARSASYAILDEADRRFVLEALSGTEIVRHYPPGPVRPQGTAGL